MPMQPLRLTVTEEHRVIASRALLGHDDISSNEDITPAFLACMATYLGRFEHVDLKRRGKYCVRISAIALDPETGEPIPTSGCADD